MPIYNEVSRGTVITQLPQVPFNLMFKIYILLIDCSISNEIFEVHQDNYKPQNTRDWSSRQSLAWNYDGKKLTDFRLILFDLFVIFVSSVGNYCPPIGAWKCPDVLNDYHTFIFPSKTKITYFYLSNRPQVSMGYRLINHAGCW